VFEFGIDLPSPNYFNCKKHFFMKFILVLFSLCIISPHIFAACPSSITINSTDFTAVTCPSNGSITIHSNVEGNGEATYQITSGPSGGGYQTTAQTSNIFQGLPAGQYTIMVTCGSATASVNVNVPNQYTPPTLSTTVTNSCTNYQTGGTITANGAGSSTPLQYAVLKVDNANEPDGSFTYGASNVFNVTSFGTYQVRVKDACNNYVTQSVQMQPTYPKAQLQTWSTYGCNVINLTYNLADYNTGQEINTENSGYKLEIWEYSGSCPGSVPTSTPTLTVTINTPGNQSTTLQSTTQNIFYRVTSICGEVYTSCNAIVPDNLYANPFVTVGCPMGGSTNTIYFKTNDIAPYTLQLTGYTAANTIIFGPQTYGPSDEAIFKNIPNADHYSYTLTDNCGHSQTGSVTTPTPGSAQISSQGTYLFCSHVLGTSGVYLYLDGSIPGLADMNYSDIKLINKNTGVSYTPNNGSLTDHNLSFSNIPNGSYTLQLPASSGGCMTTLDVTINNPVFTFSLTGTTTQLCGGNGSISASVTTNNEGAITFTLKDGSGNVVATNATGEFSNLPAGNYTVVATVDDGCDRLNSYSGSKDFVITPNGVGPVIVKKIGVICDANSTTGVAAFEFAGAAPYMLEMKESSASSYTIINSNTPNVYVVDGLSANTTYDFRLTDNCGATTSTQVSIMPLVAVNKITTDQPCVNQPYLLSVGQIPGATYSWTFNGGSPISSDPSISFASYQASNDGQYVCTVKLGDCITRTATFITNSNYCGSTMGVHFGDISATTKNGKLLVNWSSFSEMNNVQFDVEVSQDGKNFKKIASVPTKAPEGNSTEAISYSFEAASSSLFAMIPLLGLLLVPFAGKRRRLKVFVSIALIVFSTTLFLNSCKKNNGDVQAKTGIIYVRIATVDKDGLKGFSKIIKAVNE
jgi:hypothetical protein